MELPSTMIRTLCALAGLLVLSNCATTQETMQECRQAAYSVSYTHLTLPTILRV